MKKWSTEECPTSLTTLVWTSAITMWKSWTEDCRFGSQCLRLFFGAGWLLAGSFMSSSTHPRSSSETLSSTITESSPLVFQFRQYIFRSGLRILKRNNSWTFLWSTNRVLFWVVVTGLSLHKSSTLKVEGNKQEYAITHCFYLAIHGCSSSHVVEQVVEIKGERQNCNCMSI